jgi:F-box protein 3
VSENFLDQKEAELGWALPLPLRLLYRFCDGQDLSTNSEEDLSDDGDRYEDDERQGSMCPGLLGGYRFYDHEVDIKFLSLDMVILLKEKVIPKLKRLEAQNWIIIAASVPLMKFFLLNCRDGSLHVGTGNCASDGKVMSCVPPHPDSSTMQDSILRWLEEYVRRLNSGMYKVQRDRGVSRISLFPDQGPWCTEAVSQGVQVSAQS